MAARLDETDRNILRVLQEDAGRSLDEIARIVGSSKTPVWNRIRKMRAAGTIGPNKRFASDLNRRATNKRSTVNCCIA